MLSRQRSTCLTAGVLLCLTAAFATVSFGQTPLYCGQRINGSITSSALINTYSITISSAPLLVHLRVAETTANWDARMELYKPNGTKLVDTFNPDLDITLPDNGTYAFVVSGNGTGNYYLQWERVINPCSAAVMACGVPFSSAISQTGELDFYTFTVPVAGTVSIRLNETSANWDAAMNLYSPTGSLIQSTFAPQLDVALQPGVHTILVFGNGTGTYSLNWFGVTFSCNKGLQFIPIVPCRLLDTRDASFGSFGPPLVAGGSTRTVPVPASDRCSIPPTAAAYSFNVTVQPPGLLGFVTLWPTGQPQPTVSTLNALDGNVTANAAIVPAGTNGGINIFGSHDTNVILDINGYFVPPALSTLQFYPVTPCRAADTRLANGPLGGPFLSGGSTRSIPIRSTCGIPATAQAYALNLTMVPRGFLGYITAWPTGQTQPPVSTGNAPDGQVTAIAALVPAGTNGAVSFFPLQDTDLVIDINGYFAPPGAGGTNFFPTTPCRVADTRDTRPEVIALGYGLGGPVIPAGAPRNIGVPNTACGLAAGAKAWSLNVTAVPIGFLGYLTAWPAGQSQPLVSTLNAQDGQITANAALVPAGTDGALQVFVLNSSHVVLDANGYFAPQP